MKRWITILLIVIIVTAVSAGGILGTREFYFKDEGQEGKVAEEGNTVKIHYTGRLKDERIYDGWRIFDTSYYNIPDTENPKYTLTYDAEQERGEAFEFTLGEGVIEGWNENVKGMEEGESKIFEVPPEKGYGEKNEDLVYELDPTETVPVYEKMDREKFKNIHGEPRTNMVVEDNFWGWEKSVISMEKDFVKLRNDPEVGKTYGVYSEEGWEIHVESIDSNADGGSGIIQVEHDISRGLKVDAEVLSSYKEKFAQIPDLQRQAGQSGEGVGIAMFNEGKIVLDFNEEVKGKTLVFKVEVISIEKSDDTEE
ncbi:MAG: FKBP-type peptidyl-prolyl cis-trans isomerase [Candidatus Aenigmatarchaeota archaeon]